MGVIEIVKKGSDSVFNIGILIEVLGHCYFLVAPDAINGLGGGGVLTEGDDSVRTSRF